MPIGQNFYADQPYQDLQNLSRMQSAQALGYGDRAARYADPFMDQRGQYQNQLKTLMENPGEFGSSPVYEFAYNKGLDALNRRAAAQGRLKSGNYLAELMDYGKKSVSELYFPQANLLSNLAMSGSSPASAGLSYARGADRSQDYESIAALSRARGQTQGRNTPPQMTAPVNNLPVAGYGGGSYSGGSNGGYGLPSGGYYADGGSLGGMPSGYGYVQSSDGGYTSFYPGGSSYYDYNPDAGLDMGGYSGDYYQDYGVSGGYDSSPGLYSYGGGGDYWTGNLDYDADFGSYE